MSTRSTVPVLLISVTGTAARASTRTGPTAALWVAIGASTAAVGVAWAIRLAGLPAAPAFVADQRLGLFLGVAALCVMGLSARRAPSIAWIGAVVAAAVVTADLVELGLAVRAPSGPTTSVPVAIALCFTLGVAVGTAIGYAAARERRLHRVVTLIGGLVLVWVVAAGITSVVSIARGTVAADRASALRYVTLPTRYWNFLALGFVGLGILGDVAAADRRARRHGIARARAAASRRAAVADRIPPLIDELVPGRAAVRDAAVEAERTRLAAELHADVLPAVRRALDAAETGGSVERLATDLRGVLSEVEGLLVQRRSIVLEELGLLAGLEWLAERVEERSETRVVLEVADGAPNVRPPRSVERAAFRVAGLALDNAVRHAPGMPVRMDLVTRPDQVWLTVLDGGPGIRPGREAAAIAEGHRGLADMRSEAAAVGASVVIEPGPDGGTRVAFSWPSGA